jgi:fatty-acyl-CoA synthase
MILITRVLTVRTWSLIVRHSCQMTPEAELERTVLQVRQQSLGDLLRRTARRYPGKTAVVASGRRVTYAEFDDAVNRCARSLRDQGLAKGDRVGLLSHNCWQFAVLNFAAARSGLVLVPVNFMLTAGEVAYIFDHAGVRGVIAEAELVPTAEEALRLAGREDVVRGVIHTTGRTSEGHHVWIDVDTWIDPPGDASPLPDAVMDDDPIRLMYTSGTESRPKGVVLTSRSLIAQYVSCAIDGGMSLDDIELHTLPMYHCAQLDCFFGVDVYLGATSIILPAPDPAEMLETIEREQVTKLFCPPTVWISLLRHADFDKRDLSSLRKGYYGASAMPVELLREMQERLPHSRLWNFYGQTEMAPLATILGPEDQESRAGSAGRAALNVETRVVDEDDNDMPPGEIGEIVHRSPHAMLGYYHRDDQTIDAFRGGWFHSGDLGMMSSDGYLSVVDRKKDMIKTGGESVASREVEEVLYELDGVSEVAVFGVSHPHWIEAVIAVIVRTPGVELDQERVSAHVSDRLAGYKRPKYVAFADALPKNPSGKILKRDLRETYKELATRDEVGQ